MVIIQPQIILLERGGGSGGPPPEIFLLKLVQNPAILENFGRYTSLVIMPQ